MEDENFENPGLPDFLRDALGIPRRRWLAVTVGACVGLAFAATLLLRWTPIYEAAASILVASQRIPKEFVRTTVEEDAYSQLNAVVGRVLSRERLTAMIVEFDLYPGLRESFPMSEVVLRMRNAIEVEPQNQIENQRHPSARLFRISYQGADPELAAAVTNRLASLFVEAGLQDRIEQAVGIKEFLQRELTETERELRAQDDLISDFKERYRGELPSELDSNLRHLERLANQRSSLVVQIAEAETRIAMISAREIDPNSAESRLAELQGRLDRELAVRTDEHPSVLSLKRQLAAAEREVAARAVDPSSPSGVVAAMRRGIDQMRAQLVTNEEEARSLDERVARTPRRQEELAALVEKETVLREKYLEFMRKVNAAEMAQDLETAQYGAQVSILDRAQPPVKPVRSRRLLLALGIAATLGLAGGLGLLFEMLDPVLVDSDQVEGLTGMPVLGSVPRLG